MCTEILSVVQRKYEFKCIACFLFDHGYPPGFFTILKLICKAWIHIWLTKIYMPSKALTIVWLWKKSDMQVKVVEWEVLSNSQSTYLHHASLKCVCSKRGHGAQVQDQSWSTVGTVTAHICSQEIHATNRNIALNSFAACIHSKRGEALYTSMQTCVFG